MKKILLTLIVVFEIIISGNAQNDTMYILKNGVSVGKYNINTEMDSLIFYRPFTADTQNDTMYIMKSGAVVKQYNVNTQIDSVIFHQTSTSTFSFVTDIDGNIYKTVTLGTQVWMAENLKVTKYSDGTPIPNIKNTQEWAELGDNNIDKAYCFYNNNLNGEKDIYGALYTYAAAVNGIPQIYEINIQGVCPEGWHIPSHSEWKQLEIFLGMTEVEADNISWRGTDQGKKLKATFNWKDELNGTDEFGFSALAGGYCGGASGLFDNISRYGYWWSSTEGTDKFEGSAWARYLYYKYDEIGAYPAYKSAGFSVRCVKDN